MRPSCGNRCSVMSERGVQLARDRVARDQHAVDAVADPDRLVLRLDVEVGGPLGDRVVDQQLEQPHHRRIVGGDVGLRRAEGIDAFLDQVHDVGAVGVAALDQVQHVLRGAAGHRHRAVDEPLQLVEGDDVERVRLQDLERAVVEGDRREHVLPRERLGHELDRRRVGHQAVDRDERYARLARQRLGQRLLGDEVQGEEDLAEQGSAAALLRQRLIELALGNDPVGEKRLSEHVTSSRPSAAA
jgi:hypothetical protein